MCCTTMRFFTSAIRERLRQRAKVKAHKLGGVRRTSVRRSNDMGRTPPFFEHQSERLREKAKVKAHKTRGARRTSVRRSNDMGRTPPFFEHQSERLREKAKVKAHKTRGARRTSVRRSNDMGRTPPFFEHQSERLREKAKVKAHKTRGARRTSVRRSNERRSATPRLAFSRNRSGFSYLGVLILVAVMSISLIGTGRYWSTIIKRELEAELLYRGDRIREAIASYYNNPPGGQNKTYPRKFSDLLKDPRYPGVKRHLRKWYTDPMNRGKDWVYILDASQRLKGVHSAHEGTPLKTGNFPKDYSEFEQAQTYADWTFVFVPKQ